MGCTILRYQKLLGVINPYSLGRGNREKLGRSVPIGYRFSKRRWKMALSWPRAVETEAATRRQEPDSR